jgi:hypothetical protein
MAIDSGAADHDDEPPVLLGELCTLRDQGYALFVVTYTISFPRASATHVIAVQDALSRLVDQLDKVSSSPTSGDLHAECRIRAYVGHTRAVRRR